MPLARIQEIVDPTLTITFTDSAMIHEPRKGSPYIYSWWKGVNPGDDGSAWPRHAGACNVLWVDSHASSVMAANPNHPATIYDQSALTTLFADPDYWDRY